MAKPKKESAPLLPFSVSFQTITGSEVTKLQVMAVDSKTAVTLGLRKIINFYRSLEVRAEQVTD